MSLYNVERHLTANWGLTAKYYWNRPPLNLWAGSAPGEDWRKNESLNLNDQFSQRSQYVEYY